MDSYVDANGHSFGEWTETKAATCTEKGEESRSCAACGETETREIAALGHNYQDGTCTNCGEKEPTSKPSWKDWLDKILGDWWGDDEEEECDHTYTSAVTEPTCEEQGYTTHTCEKCGDTYKDSYTDALGHQFEDGICTECGEEEASEPENPGNSGFENFWDWLKNWWN